MINYMHECKYGIETMFHNYPRLLKVEGEERSLDHFKSIMAEILQQPLFINSEILKEGLMCLDNSVEGNQATIFHSLLRQKGIFSILEVNPFKINFREQSHTWKGTLINQTL